ncbi:MULTISPECIES: cardiolipin synthase [unclassified Brevibacterium]|jgi:cardiolipin synthase|uniref:cardiolipin synthase n=1 Tax=unclassified Brevibacterium TaxID=2614124 RepID=UPI001BA92B61|nr:MULTISPECIES: cardiolipin synthase [unclassified Brevibacterium]QUL79154.1 cardiolipin synthase [Brevibacterium sp. SMBL_HHYL_HB1]HJA62180.1 cardiolipin synthase [Candidatus Brevibacterium intestinavium]
MSNFGIYPFFAIDQAWPNWLIFVLLLVDLVIRIVALGWIPHNRRPSVALGWLLAIFLIPYVGILVFVLLGSAKLPKRRRDKQSQINDLIRDQLRNRAIIGQRDHMPEPLSTAAQLNFDLGALPMTHGNGFELHVDNHACMEAMADAVDRAKRFVHFEFYIVAIDDTTRRLLESLLAAHRRGVSVRILIDHVGSLGYPGYSDLVKRLDASGVSWRRALPIRPWRGEYQRPDLRNHRKILVVDGDVAFTGSQNIIDRSYNKRRNLRKGFQWKDLSLECTGPVVEELDAVFLTDWYSETDEIVEEPDGFDLEAPDSGGIQAQVVPSGPGFEDENNLRLFNHLIYNANRSVVVCSPYFVPDESLLHALTTEARSGVEVRLYVGETSDHWLTHRAQQSYYDELVRAGVRIFMYHAPTVLHSKFLIIDDEVSIIGSSNMDERSFAMNLEVTMFIVSKDFTQRMYELEAQRYAPNSVELDVEDWADRSLLKKYVENVARLTSSLL